MTEHNFTRIYHQIQDVRRVIKSDGLEDIDNQLSKILQMISKIHMEDKKNVTDRNKKR